MGTFNWPVIGGGGSSIPLSEKGAANGVATLDANTLVPITQIPPAALERLVVVANQTARYALTTATVQNGDTVKQTDTGEMWFVIDDTNLNNSSGYAVYTAGTASSVPWSGVTGVPTASASLTGVLSSTDWSTFNSKENSANKSTDTTLGLTTPSDVLFPTQKATKVYSDQMGRIVTGSKTSPYTMNITDGLTFTRSLTNSAFQVNLPDATTLSIGQRIYIRTTSSTGQSTPYQMTIKLNDGVTSPSAAVTSVLNANEQIEIVCTDNSTANGAFQNINVFVPSASTNNVNQLVKRDSSGNFSAGTITAGLTGAASLNVLKSGDTMTGSLTLGNASGSVINMDIGSANPAYSEGKVFYDNTEKTLAYYNDASGVTVNLGQETLLRVHNSTGSILPDGKAVYISGANGDRPTVALAKADNSTTAQCVGLLTADIAIGGDGYVTLRGIVHGQNTNSYSPGTMLYVSETTAGELTSTAPVAPNYRMFVGIVTRQNTNNGTIYVSVDKESYIQQLSGDVLADGRGDGVVTASVVKVNGLSIPTSSAVVGTNSSGQFINATSSLLTIGGADTQVQYNSGGTALAGSANFTWDNTNGKLAVNGVTTNTSTYIGSTGGAAGPASAANQGLGNVCVGFSAGSGATNTSSNHNTFVGYQSGLKTTTGANNVYVGYNSGPITNNSSGGGNSALGEGSGAALTSGGNNTLVGITAGEKITTGAGNVVVGGVAGILLAAHSNNTVVGYNAAANLASGTNTASGSVMVGSESGNTVTTGTSNTIIGSGADGRAAGTQQSVAIGSAAKAASGGVSIGYQAGTTLGTSTSRNVCVGYQASLKLTGADNTMIGYGAGSSATGGAAGNCTGTGSLCLSALTTGASNSAFGANAAAAVTTANHTSAFGAAALQSATGGLNSAFGSLALGNNVGATENCAFGYSAGSVVTTGSNNVFVGGEANAIANSTANAVVIGMSAKGASGSVVIGHTAAPNATGIDSIYIGENAGTTTTTGVQNVIVGKNSDTSATSTDNSVVIGYASKASTSSVSIGHGVGYNITGFYNTAVGDSSFSGPSGTAAQNCLFGYGTGASIGTGGNDNVAVGFGAAATLTSGSKNVLIGSASDVGGGTLTDCVTLGYNTIVSASNAVAIGSGVSAPNANDFILGKNTHNVQVPGTLAVAGYMTQANQSKRVSFTKTNLTNNTAVDLFTVTIGTGESVAGRLDYEVTSTGGSSDIQTHSGSLFFVAVDKGGTVTKDIKEAYTNSSDCQIVTAGTQTDNWTMKTGNVCTVQANINSSLTTAVNTVNGVITLYTPKVITLN